MAPFYGGHGGVENSALYINCNAGKLGLALDLSTEEGRDDDPGSGPLGGRADRVVHARPDAAVGDRLRAAGGRKPPPDHAQQLTHGQPRALLAARRLRQHRRGHERLPVHRRLARPPSHRAVRALHRLRRPAPRPGRPCWPRSTTGSGPGRAATSTCPRSRAACGSSRPKSPPTSPTGRCRIDAATATPCSSPTASFLAGATGPAEPTTSPSSRETTTISPRCHGVIGRPELASDPRYATADARRAHETELEAIIAGWSSGRLASEIETACHAAGVPAHRASTSADFVCRPAVGPPGPSGPPAPPPPRRGRRRGSSIRAVGDAWPSRQPGPNHWPGHRARARARSSDTHRRRLPPSIEAECSDDRRIGNIGTAGRR